MSTVTQVLRREARVAFSLNAQPLWFRIAKWTIAIAFMIAFHDRVWLWPAIAFVSVAALTLHFIYRSKTRVWTQAWGGWNDLSAGRD